MAMPMNHEAMISKRSLGTQYEEKAALALESLGYVILDKNVNYRWGEIDLVTIDQDKKELVFVEVRHRAENSMTSPAESITPTKLIRLKRAINSYLVSPQFGRRGLNLNGVRIDLIAFEGERMSHWKQFI